MNSRGSLPLLLGRWLEIHWNPLNCFGFNSVSGFEHLVGYISPTCNNLWICFFLYILFLLPLGLYCVGGWFHGTNFILIGRACSTLRVLLHFFFFFFFWGVGGGGELGTSKKKKLFFLIIIFDLSEPLTCFK